MSLADAISDPEVCSIKADDFISSMRRVASSVNIITTGMNGVYSGLTATAVCSLSAEPPRILCCINQKGVTLQAIRDNQNFCVNVLSAEDQDVARRFAGMKDIGDEDRFVDGNWINLSSGAPALRSAISSLDCLVDSMLDYQSHAIVIGRVIDVRNENILNPLLWLDGGFAQTDLKENA